jgi:Fe-S cluster assembly ATPase SufC
MFDDGIAKEGAQELVDQLEAEGYGRLREEVGAAV